MQQLLSAIHPATPIKTACPTARQTVADRARGVVTLPIPTTVMARREMYPANRTTTTKHVAVSLASALLRALEEPDLGSSLCTPRLYSVLFIYTPWLHPVLCGVIDITISPAKMHIHIGHVLHRSSRKPLLDQPDQPFHEVL